MSKHHEEIDAAGEREAESLDYLADLTGQSLPQTRLQVALEQARAAAALGLMPPRRCVYAWVRSCESHERLCRASMHRLVWGPPASKRVGASIEDHQRRAQKKLRRAALLLQLNREPSGHRVTIAAAATLSGFGARTLQRAAETGRLPAVRDFTPSAKNGVGDRGRWFVAVGDVRRLLSNKLNGGNVAA